jgi:hypothetical protein
VAGQIIIGKRDLPSADIHSIAVTIRVHSTFGDGVGEEKEARAAKGCDRQQGQTTRGGWPWKLVESCRTAGMMLSTSGDEAPTSADCCYVPQAPSQEPQLCCATSEC